MLNRASTLFSLAIVIAAAISGVVGLPFWTAMVGGCGLALIATRQQHKLRPRYASVGAADMLMTAHAASLLNALLTTLAAWGVGLVLRWAVMSVA